MVRRLGRWMLWLVALGVPTAVAAKDSAQQTVRIEVVVLEGEPPSGIAAHTVWLGQAREVELLRTGNPEDSTWTAQWSGDPVRLLPVRIVAQCGMGAQIERTEVYADIELIRKGTQVLAFALRGDCGAPAMRVTHADPDVLDVDVGRMSAYAGWAIACLLLVFWLAAREEERAPANPLAGRLSLWFFAWLALAVAWTWPAVLAGPDDWVGRHFDLPGTVWSLSAIPRLDSGFLDMGTAWPLGAVYRRFDSYTLLLVGWLFDFVHPARLHGLIQVLGIALSAWAAQGFARAVGARTPWDLFAGVCFAFSGIASIVLLEGHAYHLLNPWLPLFAWSWWRAMSASGTVWSGFFAGVFFVLSLLTTVYLGVAAAVIAAMFFIGGLLSHGRIVLAPALAAWIPVIVIAIVAGAVLGGNHAVHDVTSMTSMQLGSANLSNLLAPTPQIDLDLHSIAPTLSPIALALLVVSPWVLRGGRGDRVLLWTAVVGLVLSLGPTLNADAWTPLVPLPITALIHSLDIGFLRFPVRMMWIWGLCAGVLGARVMTVLARRHRWGAALLLIAAVLHAFFGVRQPFRQAVLPGAVPSAYAFGDGPILDLFPAGSDRDGEQDLWFTALACGYQVEHARPIADQCVSTIPDENPRNLIGAIVRRGLTDGRVRFVQQLLGGMGFAAVALHEDLFSAGDAARLRAALSSFGPPIVETFDGGEHIVLAPISASARSTELTQEERISVFTDAMALGAGDISTIGGGMADEAMSGVSDVTRSLRLEVRVQGRDVASIDTWEVIGAGAPADLFMVNPSGKPSAQGVRIDPSWVGTWNGDISERLDLQVRGTSAHGDEVAWSGVVYPRSPAERLVFWYDESGVRPVIATAYLRAQPQRSNPGPWMLSIWGVFLLVTSIGVWRLRPRWSAPPPEG